MFYVYELVDPRTGTVFYVGKGKGNRIDQHETEARRGRQSRKCDVIRAIEAAGLAVVKRKVATYTDEQEAYDAEALLIAEYGLMNLTNVVCKGGGLSAGYPSTQQDRASVIQIARMFVQMKDVDLSKTWLFGKPYDFSFVRPALQSIVERIASRRTLEWVNEVAGRQRVQFCIEPHLA